MDGFVNFHALVFFVMTRSSFLTATTVMGVVFRRSGCCAGACCIAGGCRSCGKACLVPVIQRQVMEGRRLERRYHRVRIAAHGSLSRQ